MPGESGVLVVLPVVLECRKDGGIVTRRDYAEELTKRKTIVKLELVVSDIGNLI